MKNLWKACALVLMTGAVWTSCTKKYYYEDDERTQIRLSSQVDVSFERAVQDLQIVEGRSLSLFVTLTEDTGNILYNNQTITADGQGGFISSIMYYPLNGDHVNFYAVHPYSSAAELNEDLDFSVLLDQTLLNNYLSSDLLFASTTDVPRSSNEVSMTFTHKMAKIDFTIKAGAGVDLTSLNAINILGLLPATTINTQTGVIGAASGTVDTVRVYNVNATTLPTADATGGTAIVVPQTFTAGARLFEVIVGTTPFYYTPANDIVFQSGYKYDLVLTLNQNSGITLTSTISPWESGGTITGDGTAD